MIQSWKNFHIVLLLAFLQCFAPMLHAHAMGDSSGGEVHFHADDHAHVPTNVLPNQPAYEVCADEYPAIGMAQVYKKDIFFIAADSPFLFTWAANVLTQSRQAPVLVSKLLGVSAYLAPYSLSLSQAPPFSS